MPALRVAAVQAAYVLMDRDATIDRVAGLTAEAAREGAQLVVFPEVFVPGTPIWIDTQPIWEGDEDWFGLLAANAVVIGSPATERLAAIAAQHQVWLVVGVDEPVVGVLEVGVDVPQHGPVDVPLVVGEPAHVDLDHRDPGVMQVRFQPVGRHEDVRGWGPVTSGRVLNCCCLHLGLRRFTGLGRLGRRRHRWSR